MKCYGSLSNRLEENKMYCEKIEVGTYATEYLWSDSHAYEVVEIVDKETIGIRKLKAIRIDKNGMSDSQEYRYDNDTRQGVRYISFRNGKWKDTKLVDMKCLNSMLEYYGAGKERLKDIAKYLELTDNQFNKVLNGGKVKKYCSRINISFGVTREYFDYSF